MFGFFSPNQIWPIAVYSVLSWDQMQPTLDSKEPYLTSPGSKKQATSWTLQACRRRAESETGLQGKPRGSQGGSDRGLRQIS